MKLKFLSRDGGANRWLVVGFTGLQVPEGSNWIGCDETMISQGAFIGYASVMSN